MPCPANPPGGQEVQVERFHLLHPSNGDHVNGHRGAISPYDQALTASRLVSHHLPLQGVDLNGSTQSLNGNGALFRPLKAIPPESYYKLHRVPSLSSMAEPHPDGTDAVQLPRRESTTAPPAERAPQNAIHNKILEQVVRTPGRQPSPQPTHLSVPGSSQPRVLPGEGSGYVAPKFEGKDLQMEEGKALRLIVGPRPQELTHSFSYGSPRRKRFYTP